LIARRITFIGLALCLGVAPSAPSLDAGNWDGHWSGPVEPVNSTNSKNCGSGQYDLTIANSKIAGGLTLVTPKGTTLNSEVTGEVDSSGTARLIVTGTLAHARNSKFSVKYDGRKFVGTDHGSANSCSFSVELMKQ
jgi:hypothetical protein